MSRSAARAGDRIRSRRIGLDEAEPVRTPGRGTSAQHAAATLASVGPVPASAIASASRAVQRFAGNQAARVLVQRRLAVGPAGDRYEQEADQVARAVMSMPSTATATTSADAMEGCEEDHDHAIHRVGWGDGFDADPAFEQALGRTRGGGQPLPTNLRSEFEPKFGADFGGVRVHATAEAGQLSQSIQAKAFTHGSNIYLGSGAYNPASTSGKELLAHELTHVVQQGGARSVRRSPVADFRDTNAFPRKRRRTAQ